MSTSKCQALVPHDDDTWDGLSAGRLQPSIVHLLDLLGRTGSARVTNRNTLAVFVFKPYAG